MTIAIFVALFVLFVMVLHLIVLVHELGAAIERVVGAPIMGENLPMEPMSRRCDGPLSDSYLDPNSWRHHG